MNDIAWNPDAKARARELLLRLLPTFRDRDQALDNLYFVDPENDLTRLPSIAAALYVLGFWPERDSVKAQPDKDVVAPPFRNFADAYRSRKEQKT